MELVYLWVEKYKNIKNQGFNFSPRFECEFENGNLTICDKKEKDNNCKNKDYIENFFGKNINVTAIVGENGSGKSSIIETIYYLIYFNQTNNEYETNLLKSKEEFTSFSSGRVLSSYRKKNYVEILEQLKEEDINAFLIIRQDNKNYILTNNINFQNISKDILNMKKKISSEFIYFNFFGISFENKFKNRWYRAFYKDIEYVKNDMNIPLLCEPYVQDKDSNITIDNDNILMLRYSRIFNKIKENFFLNKIFNPKYVNLKLNSSYFYDRLEVLSINNLKNPLVDFSDNIGYNIYVNEDSEYIFDNQDKYNQILEIIKKALEEYDVIILMQVYVLFEILLNAKAVENAQIVYLGNKFKDETKFQDILNEIDNEIKNDKYYLVSIMRDSNGKLIELDNLIWILKNYRDYNFLKEEKIDINKYLSYIQYIPKWVYIEFLDNEKTINSLSSGEKSLFDLVINIFYHYYMNQIDNSASKVIHIILDEVEVGKHPMWQKSLINNLMNLFNEQGLLINFIISTHSPFILSDIPNQNIIFLKKDENTGYCINDTKDMELKTFGANIHTLLSHGFFMSDGLMGEFAKNKIRTIQIAYKYISHRNKQKSLHKKEHKKSRRFIRIQLKTLWYIQSIIGEKFLRTIMKNYLQEIEEILFGNEKAIDNEIERLQNLKKSIKKC